MAAYLALLVAILWLIERFHPAVERSASALAACFVLLPGSFRFGPAPAPYSEALYARDYFFLYNWTWYHWLGLLAPLVFLVWFSKGNLRATTPAFKRLSLALIPFGLLSILAAAVISSSHNFDMFARLQPLRCFHLVTVVFMLFLGGVIGEFVADGRLWVIPALSSSRRRHVHRGAPNLPLQPAHRAARPRHQPQRLGQRAALGAPQHPGRRGLCRGLPLPDGSGRRCARLSRRQRPLRAGRLLQRQRRRLALPSLAIEWKQMSDATYGLDHFTTQDFIRLAHRYPVTWTVIHGPAPAGMECPYQQRGYSVCKIPLHNP